MAEKGTGYIIRIEVENTHDIPMSELDVQFSFYVDPYRRVRLRKEELVRIRMRHGDLYYALLDSRQTGSGEVMCETVIRDPEPKWPGGLRPVVLVGSTGLTVGMRHRPCRKDSGCFDYDEGYRVRFSLETRIPKPEAAYIIYGSIANRITSYSDITQDMLIDPANHIVSVDASPLGKTSCGTMAEGDKVVVLVPEDTQYSAQKDNGFGGRMAFSEAVLGCNGQYRITVDGTVYRVYGEMMTTEGEMFIYVS